MSLRKNWGPPIQMGEGMAHWLGSTELPLINETLHQHFTSIAQDLPTKLAVRTSRRALTYQELEDESTSLARSLTNFGIGPESCVAISLGNCIEYLVMVLACSKIGAISVTLNPAYTPEQTLAAMVHVSACCLFTSLTVTPPYKQPRTNAALLRKLASSLKDNRRFAIKSSLQVIILLDSKGLDVDFESAVAVVDYAVSLQWNGQIQLKATTATPEDIVNLQFTSGTTSNPKAVCLTHRGLLNNAKHIGQVMQYSAQDVVCCPFPLYHCSGLVIGFLASIFQGATVILPSESFNPAAVLEVIKVARPTVLHGVPTMFEAIIEQLPKTPSFPLQALEHVRTGLLGGSPISAHLRRKIQDQLGITGLVNAYGMTELSPLATVTAPSDDSTCKVNTVGRVIPHCRIKIVAQNDPSQTLRTGQKGELMVCGYLLMKGYWRDHLQTKQSMYQESHADGSGHTRWMRTGDEATIDQKGYVRITGRFKDIIIRGGENIYPSEVESCLTQHPQIECAAVVGIPHQQLGEVLVAFLAVISNTKVISPDLSESYDLREAMSCGQPKCDVKHTEVITPTMVRTHIESSLARHYVPKHIFWVSEMPLTPSGKVAKYKLRLKAIEMLTNLAN